MPTGREAENPLINELLGPLGLSPTRAPDAPIPERRVIQAKAGAAAGNTRGRKRRKTSVRSAPRTQLL